MHAHKDAHIDTQIHAHSYTYIHTCTYTYMHTYVHAYTWAHTHKHTIVTREYLSFYAQEPRGSKEIKEWEERITRMHCTHV